MVNCTWLLSNDATPITLSPTPGRAGRVDAVCATVADGRDDDDAGVDECIGCGRGWRSGPVVERVADGHVEDVLPSALMRSIAAIMTSSVTEPVAAEYAVGAEAHVGRNASPPRLSRGPVGADDAGDVRPVTVAVVRDGVGLGTGL